MNNYQLFQDNFYKECEALGIKDSGLAWTHNRTKLFVLFASEEDMNLYKLSGGELKCYGLNSNQELCVGRFF